MDWFDSAVGSTLPLSVVLVRITLATLLGGVIGWEREARHKAAGLRTHMLVALGAAVFMMAALQLDDLTAAHGGNRDASRTVQGIVQGIGFLGAGQVILSRSSVHGMTTAIGIWVMGAVGVACGAGFYALSVIATAFALAVLHGAAALERHQ